MKATFKLRVAPCQDNPELFLAKHAFLLDALPLQYVESLLRMPREHCSNETHANHVSATYLLSRKLKPSAWFRGQKSNRKTSRDSEARDSYTPG